MQVRKSELNLNARPVAQTQRKSESHPPLATRGGFSFARVPDFQTASRGPATGIPNGQHPAHTAAMTITDLMSSAANVPRFGRTPCQMFPTLFDLDYRHTDRAAAATAAVFLYRHECPALRECRH